MQQPQSTMMLGRYQIIREIARSNDIVWEGIDPTMNRRVAVKELALPANLAGEARRNRIERFYREARAAGAMSHSNIVTIYEVGEDHGRYFIAMEFLEGQTLRERLALGGALPLADALRIATELADALDYAHRHGVIHRDIKPENVHLLPGDRAKLTDFGIARITTEEQLTVAGQVFGTPSYMSPEQILGKPIDARSDLFSLGVLLYEMVTGRKPFTLPGDSVVTITYRIMNDAPPQPVGIPTVAQAMLERALAKAPEGRYQTAADFRSALRASTANMSSAQYSADVQAGMPMPANASQPVSFGAQTEMISGPQPPVGVAGPRLATPTPTGSPTGLPSYSPEKDDRSRRMTAVLVATFAGIVVLIGAIWAFSVAYRNLQADAVNRAAYTHDVSTYSDAMKLYQSGSYEQAASQFKSLRLAATTDHQLAIKAGQGELYSYRKLGHDAQEQGDFVSAVRWYKAALDVDPTDSDSQKELQAAQLHVGGSTASATPSPAASSLAGSPSPSDAPSAAPTEPPTTTNQFVTENAARASQALAYFTQGDQAYSQGDRASALRLWKAAVTAGPGSPGAIQAQQRISEVTSQVAPY